MNTRWKKERKECTTLISKANITRHRTFCYTKEQWPEEIDELETLPPMA